MGRSELCCLLVSVVALVMVPPSCQQADLVDNCRPKGGETILCDDREDICTDLGVSVIYNVDNYCKDGKVPFINPEYICNCDVICVDEIAEGDDCEINYASEYPTELCGNGLDCMLQGSKRVCARNPEKDCVNRTIQYEQAAASGQLSPGLLYPNCDNIGQYAAVQCSTSTTCYCTDSEGNRLFGEAAYTERDAMDCECSLHWLKNDEMGLTEGMRCLANGNLDPLQCNSEFCFCYNSTLASITNGPFHPSQMFLLSCYDPSYHTENYTNICTRAAQLYDLTVPESDDGITLGSSLRPNCSLDGYYAAVQRLEDGTYYCSDPLGNQIEDYSFTTAEAPKVTCNCARRRYVLQQAGLTSYLPQCCANGNFLEYQTRGLFAYCVDVNGDQVGEAKSFADWESLNCPDVQC